jgi:glutamate-5-semialdehyde dehydrogenase
MKIEDNLSSSDSVKIAVKRAYEAFLALDRLKGIDRSQGMQAMAQGLQNAWEDILEANTLDLEMSREMAIPDLVLDWLKLTPERLQTTIQILKRLGTCSDPIQRLMNARYQLDPSQTYCQLMPLGVIAFIYESFPELGAIAAGLAIKSGNSIILRGGGEASHSNTIIGQTLRNSLEEAGLPVGCVEVLSSDQGSSIQDLVKQDSYLNLIIPYGRPTLIQQVTQLATVPVLKTAMGNCYLYWASSGDLDLARWVILDSHSSEPDPINAIEKVLISVNQKSSSLVRLFSSLQEKGFILRGDAGLVNEFSEYLTLADNSEWETPYLKKIVAFKMVEDLEAGINWINYHSSGHSDCLVTASYQESRQFAKDINSALVYINSSPRFERNPKRGDSVFLGISNQKGHRRGLIGLETLTTLKQVVQGEGRV